MAVAFSGDTADCEAFWERLAQDAQLAAVVIECSYPLSMAAMAELTRHMHAGQVAARVQHEGQFRLGPEDCSRLQQEAIQFHHRYICFYQLEDYDAVERDSARNLEVFDFVRAFAVNEELAWSVNQFAPQLFLMRTRAVANRALKSKKHSEAVRQIEMGIGALEGFYRDFEREDLLDNSAEIEHEIKVSRIA